MPPRPIALLLIALCILAAGCTSYGPGGPAGSTPSPTIAGATLVAIPITTVSAASGSLVVRFLEVGQGDAILQVGPSGKTMLIDAGPAAAGPSVSLALRNFHVSVLDVVVATNPRDDHIGGMQALLNTFTVKEFVDAGYPNATGTYGQMRTLIEEKKIPCHTVSAGDTIAWEPNVSVEVLNPQKTFFDDGNENSIVLRVVHGSTGFFFASDAGEFAEAVMIDRVLDADILKVGNHGNSSSTGAALLSTVKPEVGVITAGCNGPVPDCYGQVGHDTIRRLALVGTSIYRTDHEGTVTITSMGSGYSVATSRIFAPRIVAESLMTGRTAPVPTVT